MQPYQDQDIAPRTSSHPNCRTAADTKKPAPDPAALLAGTSESGSARCSDCALAASARATWKALGACWQGSGLPRWVAPGKMAASLAQRALKPQVLQRASNLRPRDPPLGPDRAPLTAVANQAAANPASGTMQEAGTAQRRDLFTIPAARPTKGPLDGKSGIASHAPDPGPSTLGSPIAGSGAAQLNNYRRLAPPGAR